MSYFVFGTVEAARAAAPLEAHLRDAARRAGVHVAIGAEIPQRIILEMLAQRPVVGALAFMLTAGPGDDTSHDLLAHRPNGIVPAAAGRIGAWVEHVREDRDVSSLRVWTADGFDIAFEDVVCSAEKFTATLAERIEQAGDVPPLRIVVLASAGRV